MINPERHKWIERLAEVPSFNNTITLTEVAIEKQLKIELVLRFLAFRHVPYQKGLDVHDYLDSASIKIAKNENFPAESERTVFISTFDFIHTALGDKAFRRWEGARFTGKFLMSVFEVLAFGLSKNLSKLSKLTTSQRNNYIQQRAKDLWEQEEFRKYSGPGVRGSDRLSHLLPLAEKFMKP